MGEAKRRGTYEQRRAVAQGRIDAAKQAHEKARLERYAAMTPQERVEAALLQTVVQALLHPGRLT